MSEIERLAEAAQMTGRRQAMRGGISEEFIDRWAELAEGGKEDWREIVRAVLTAMREPDDATIYAGIVAQRSRRPEWHYEPEVTKAVFAEMIDALTRPHRDQLG